MSIYYYGMKLKYNKLPPNYKPLNNASFRKTVKGMLLSEPCIFEFCDRTSHSLDQ